MRCGTQVNNHHTTTDRTCSFSALTPQPGDTCRTVSTTSFRHFSTSYEPNHTYVPISSDETTTIAELYSSREIVTGTVETSKLYYDSDGDGDVDGSCTTQEIETDYVREPHPSHALRQTVVWETEYVDCPPAP
ncbi:hypothetical protein [Oceanithermus sp.]